MDMYKPWIGLIFMAGLFVDVHHSVRSLSSKLSSILATKKALGEGSNEADLNEEVKHRFKDSSHCQRVTCTDRLGI
jgi:hypothetical protein